MAELDLLLKTLLFGDDDSDGLSVPETLYNDINRQDDSVPHPVDAFFERVQLERAGIQANDGDDWNQELGGTPLSKRAEEASVHADGIEIEKVGAQIWKHRYEGGKHVGSTLFDPELPPPHTMSFDGDGNEIAA